MNFITAETISIKIKNSDSEILAVYRLHQIKLGFRKNIGTENALKKFNSEIYKNIDQN